MAQKKQQTNLAHIYQHTHIAVYLVGSVTVASLVYDSTQVPRRSICGLRSVRVEGYCARALTWDMQCSRESCRSTSSTGNGSICMVSTSHQLNAEHFGFPISSLMTDDVVACKSPLHLFSLPRRALPAERGAREDIQQLKELICFCCCRSDMFLCLSVPQAAHQERAGISLKACSGHWDGLHRNLMCQLGECRSALSGRSRP